MTYQQVIVNYNNTPDDEVYFVIKRTEFHRRLSDIPGVTPRQLFDVQHLFATLFYVRIRELPGDNILDMICDPTVIASFEIMVKLKILNCIHSDKGYGYEINW